jgi:hypothetical protein
MMSEAPSDSAGPLSLLPDPAFRDLRPVLAERLEHLAAAVHGQQFASLLDPVMRQTLERGFAAAGAHEGTVWLLDETEENLVAAYNSGPQAAQWVGQFKLPLRAGLICMVFASEQPFLENEVWKNARQSKLLDSLLQVRTGAMIAVPFYLLRACRGVISCVQLQRNGTGALEPPGFRPEHLEAVQWTATALSQLLELRLLSHAVGWTCE